MSKNLKKVKAFDYKTVLLALACIGLIIVFGMKMGMSNFFSSAMKTAHNLLLETVFFITALCVLAGAMGNFLSEFGILALLNWMLAPAVRLLWGLPGAATMGAISTYISDNPAIIALAREKNFIKYFKTYQRPALTNFGTSFGMGLILTAFMMSLGFFKEAMLGNLAAVLGSIISTRMMLYLTRKELGDEIDKDDNSTDDDNDDLFNFRYIRDGNLFQRFLDSILEGGKSGLRMGFQIAPGVLIICTMVLMLTFGPGENGYDGSAYQGVPILTDIGRLFYQPLRILFGFQSPDAIAFPITSLGAAGAAISIIPKLLAHKLIGGNEIAVFTAMGMCWSGYLSTHVAMMDALGFRQLTIKAILCHTCAGFSAGILAHLGYVLIF